MTKPTIVWFRQDLRLEDNPALTAAAQRGGPVIPVYIHAPQEEAPWAPGGATRWWLHQSLAALGKDLRAAGSRLILRYGDTLEALRALIRETGAGAVFWNRRYEPQAVAQESLLAATLLDEENEIHTFNSSLLFEPWDVLTKEGNPYRVFTPFWRACLHADSPAEPLSSPSRLTPPSRWPKSVKLTDLELEPRPDWAAGLRETWQPGAAGAMSRWQAFFEDRVGRYDRDRNRPDRDGVSALSPYLHHGEISPRLMWHALLQRRTTRKAASARGVETYMQQLVWREFAHHLLYHFPHTSDEPLRPEFGSFPWQEDEGQLHAWQKGRTGYPIVDAGMRQLWVTGWMHNRIRMVVASFLVKDLLLPWQAGARWFWDTLVDADLANNTLGWQWTAGCGADAAPYFRIFNPVTQGERFDPHGGYVRRWVPELSGFPGRWIHKPWQAPSGVLNDAQVVLGESYPRPIVDHAEARGKALAAFNQLKSARAANLRR
ncbi:MAG: deoxyribodipyrimidine photo-lyase [Phycisphaerales bacterium]|nr:MAG: deoxyribodipyrimidine photo-lyase [Phycisphaerales bacterium]